MMCAGIFQAAGSADNQMTCKFAFPALYLAFVALTYYAARWRLDGRSALLVSALFATSPTLVRWSGAGTADMALSFFHAASVLFIVKFMENGKSSDIIVSALFSWLCASTKNEGMPLMLINASAVLAFCIVKKKGLDPFAVYMLISGVLSLFPGSSFQWTYPGYTRIIQRI